MAEDATGQRELALLSLDRPKLVMSPEAARAYGKSPNKGRNPVSRDVAAECLRQADGPPTQGHKIFRRALEHTTSSFELTHRTRTDRRTEFFSPVDGSRRTTEKGHCPRGSSALRARPT
jgi:hypothetical protein